MPLPHQAQGLQRLFSSERGVRRISVLSAPQAPDSQAVTLALADALTRREQRVVLVEAGAGGLSARLGCRPLLPWQPGLPLESQLVSAGANRLLYAPGRLAGETAIAEAAQACRDLDVLLFDGGRFTPDEAPLESATAQTVIVLLGAGDAEAAYALVKALKIQHAPARLLLAGEEAGQVAQLAEHFLGMGLDYPKAEDILYHMCNNDSRTSSNTLSIASNLPLVVSRITGNDQLRMAHGGFGKKPSAKEV